MPNEFRDNVEHVLAAAPVLKNYPNDATALALTPGMDDASIQSMAGLRLGMETRNFLEGLPPDQRADQWNRLSNDQRGMAATAGYNPAAPGTDQAAPPQQTGEVDDPNALKSLWHGTKWLGGKTMAGLMWGRKHVTHFERTYMDYGQSSANLPDWAMPIVGLPGIGNIVGGAAGVFDPDGLAEAWRRTADGEKAYDTSVLAEVQSQYAPDVFSFAKRRAEGESMDSILGSATSQEQRDIYDNAMHNPLVQEAIDSINNAKLSPGRALARAIGVDPVHNQSAFKWTSGTVDAVDTLFADPLIVGSKLASTVRVAKYGLQGISRARVEETLAQPAVQRYLTGATPHINAILSGRNAGDAGKAYEELQTKYSRMLPMLNSLREYARSEAPRAANGRAAAAVNPRAVELTVDDIGDFFMGRHGMGLLMDGKAAYRGPMMPTKGLIFGRSKDYIKSRVRAGTSWFEKPSHLYHTAMTNTLDDFQNGYLMASQGRLLAELRDQGRFLGVGKASRSSRRYRTGMALTRFTEQAPSAKGGRLDLLAPDASKVMYNMARMYLPRWHANQVAGAFAAADLGGRELIYKGLVLSLGEAAGVTRDDVGRAWLQGFVNEVDTGIAQNRSYSALRDNDVFEPGRRDALYPHQMQTEVALPSFKEMHEFASRKGVFSALGGYVTHPALDWFTTGWRAGVLLRPAVALRNSLEENANHIGKYGVWDWTKGAAGRHVMDKAAKEYARTGMVVDIEHRLTHGLGRILGQDEKRFLREFAADEDALAVYLQGIRDTSLRAMTNREAGQEIGQGSRFRRRAGRDYEVRFRQTGNYRPQDTLDGEGVRRWAGSLRTLLQHGSPARIAMQHIDDEQTAIAKLTEHILSDGFKRNREYSRAWRVLTRDAPDDLAKQAEAARTWAQRMYLDTRHHVSDPNGNLLDDLVNEIRRPGPNGGALNLETISTRRLSRIAEETRPAQVTAGDTVYLESGSSGPITWAIEKGYELSGRATGFLGKNNIYYANYLDARKASAAWERQLADDLFETQANRLGLAASDPQVIAALERRGLRQRIAALEDEITQADAAAAGAAPEWAAAGRDVREAAAELRQAQARMAQLAEPPPGIAEHAERVAKVRAKAEATASKMVTQQSARTAEMQTLAYVDNPDIRSQASIIFRNIVPFGRAQEEFFRRWGRTIKHNPEAIRRLQMLNEGAHHSGFVTKDEEGNDIFVYPGSRAVQELMYGVGKKLGWDWAMSPVPSPLTSQVRFLNQGMDPKNVLPSVGPLAAVPMKSLEAILPESVALRQANRRILGDQGANSSALGSVMPTFARRLYASGIFGNDSEQLASATKQALVYLEAAGRTPPEGADPEVVEDYLDQVKKWSRVSLFMRAVFGTTAPAAPAQAGAPSSAPIGDEIRDDPGVYMAQHQLIDSFRRDSLPTVASEFRAEVARLDGDYNTALANWIRLKPDQLPFAVGTSEATYGGYVPATAAAGRFYDNNRALFDNYPAAATLFMPQGDGEFDMDVYRSQFGSGLRERKDLKEFALDLKLAGNLQTYYDLKDLYVKMRTEAKAGGDTAAATAADTAWSEASKRFKLSHPAVGQHLDNYQERQNDRARVMLELQRMIENNSMPNIPGRQAIVLMVDAYRKRADALAPLEPLRTREALAQKAAIKSSFQDYVKGVAATDLNADMVYQRLFRSLGDD